MLEGARGRDAGSMADRVGRSRHRRADSLRQPVRPAAHEGGFTGAAPLIGTVGAANA